MRSASLFVLLMSVAAMVAGCGGRVGASTEADRRARIEGASGGGWSSREDPLAGRGYGAPAAGGGGAGDGLAGSVGSGGVAPAEPVAAEPVVAEPVVAEPALAGESGVEPGVAMPADVADPSAFEGLPERGTGVRRMPGEIVRGAWPNGELTPAGFPIDRRPIHFVYLSGTGFAKRVLEEPGPSDRNGNGRPDGADALLARLDLLYNSGARRIFIDRQTGGNLRPSYEMSAWGVRLYEQYVGPWFDARPDAQFVTHLLPQYRGAGETEKPAGIGEASAVREHTRTLMAEFEFWQRVGVDLHYLDASFRDFEMLGEMNRSNLLFDEATGRRLFLGSEAGAAIPMKGRGSDTRIPWFAAGRNNWWTWWVPGRDQATPDRFAVIDPEEISLVHYFRAADFKDPTGDPVSTLPMAYRMVRSGKILAAEWNSIQRRWTQRIYEFGAINGADFDGDGEVTEADLELFTHAVARTGPFEGIPVMADPSFIEGDVDFDGVVTRDDVRLFGEMYLSKNAPVEMGPINREYAGWTAWGAAESAD